MKMTVFWEVAPCSLVEIELHFRGAYASIITLMMEAVSTFETLVSFCQTTRRDIPEDSHLHIRLRENLKCHLKFGIIPHVCSKLGNCEMIDISDGRVPRVKDMSFSFLCITRQIAQGATEPQCPLESCCEQLVVNTCVLPTPTPVA
jgi:hypothetical protein